MAATLSSATQSLSNLLRQTSLEDHEEVLRAANGVLKKSKQDLNAQHVKVTALLKLDRHKDALRVFDEGDERLRRQAGLERAYALYKVGDFKEAQAAAKSASVGRGAQHVEAQVTYRLENFVRAAELYAHLSANQFEVENEENDLRINGGAAAAQLEWAKSTTQETRKPSRDDLEAFETAYNAACWCLARNDLSRAVVLLHRAKDLCNALDELSDEEKDAELLSIDTQRVYVLSRIGRIREAEEICSNLKIADIPDLSTKQIAQNNLLSFSSQLSNPFLGHRLLHTVSELPRSARAFSFQSDQLRRNQHSIDLSALKYDGVFGSTSKYLSEQDEFSPSIHTASISVINAAAKAHCRLGKAALKEIVPLLLKRPDDVGLILTVVHLYVLTNNHGSAIHILESFFARLDESGESRKTHARFIPGLVALLVSLYSLHGRKSHARKELARAASYWRVKQKAPVALLQSAGVSLLESSNPEDLSSASEIFGALRQKDEKDPIAVAGYIASVAIGSPDKAEPHIHRLTPVARLTAGINGPHLEEAGIPSMQPGSKGTMGKKRTAEEGLKSSKKRVRKSRLPKDYDSAKPVDPERWLPLKDRSSYRPKGKKAKHKAAALTQGGVSTPTGTESGEAGPAKPQVGIGGTANKSKKKKAKGGKK